MLVWKGGSMTKIIEIENCLNCIHCYKEQTDITLSHCMHEDNIQYILDNPGDEWFEDMHMTDIIPLFEIPSWCPLHDKEENKPLELMKWLNSMIEDIECDDSLDLYSTPTHEYHTKQGILRGLRMVEDKVKGLGLNNKQTGYD